MSDASWRPTPDKVTDDDIRTLVIKLLGWCPNHYLNDGLYWKPVTPEQLHSAIREIVDRAVKLERDRSQA